MKNKIYLLALLILYCMNSFSQQVDPAIFKDFKENGFSEGQTYEILDELYDVFTKIQVGISQIASKYVPYEDRQRKKRDILKHFVSSLSIIEVTSINSNIKKRREIGDYLDRLLYKSNYYTVTIYFDNSFSVSKIFDKSGEQSKIAIGIWQYYVAKNGDGCVVYADKTFKRAFFVIRKNSDSSWTIKVEEIKADETAHYNLKSEPK